MKAAELCDILKRTLDDGQLSRQERQALRKVLREEAIEGQDLMREAFRAVDASTENISETQALKWLRTMVHYALEDEESAEGRVYFSPGEAPRRAILRACENAQKSIDICVFTITDNLIRDSLVAAYKRGLRLRIISDDEKAHDRGSDIFSLEQAGLPVRFDDNPAHMHHKFALFDRETLLSGSYNWTRSAFVQNFENILVTEDPGLVSPYRREFERLWSEMDD